MGAGAVSAPVASGTADPGAAPAPGGAPAAVAAVGFAALHRRELARDPWTWAVAALLPATALAWRALAPEVGVVSTFGVAALVGPPAVVALVAPRLARRATWAFWGSLAARPGRAFAAAALGATLGVLPALLAGAALAAAVLGAGAAAAAALVAAVAAVLVPYAALAALLAAATLDPARSVAMGAAVWAVATVAYEPALVALAGAFADRPFEPFLAAALLAHPGELARLALLRALDAPVFVGPTGLLVARWLGPAPAMWALAATALVGGSLVAAAGAVFARRPR